MNEQRIGIMGGTFDPVHYGHLVTAEAARNEFSLDKVIFIPTGSPPHKRQTKYSEGTHRLAMTSLAIASNPHFILCPIEMQRHGYSYSVDTVASLKLEYGPDTAIFFIAGADAVLDIPTWHDADSLMGLCRFIAATRPGFDLTSLNKLPTTWREKIEVMSIPALDISSTDIRNRVRQGKSIKYLLPEGVEEYIYTKRLYE
jgi:nicotinate-nucleotide adenylyltransferase